MMAATMDVEKTNPNTHNELLDRKHQNGDRMCKIKRGDDELVQPKVVADIATAICRSILRLPALQVLYSDTDRKRGPGEIQQVA